MGKSSMFWLVILLPQFLMDKKIAMADAIMMKSVCGMTILLQDKEIISATIRMPVVA
jgi:hypothetical protein